MKRWSNELEPPELVDAFLRHPPDRFKPVALTTGGAPCFETRFNLTTTLEDPVRGFLRKIPGFAAFTNLLLSPRTLFVGSTVSEYALFSPAKDPAAMIDEILQAAGSERTQFTIIKDLPIESPLLEPSENEYARRLAEVSRDRGFLAMSGQALAYVPITFSSIDEYLSQLSSSRRKDLKRKLKKRSELDVSTLQTGAEEFGDDGFLAKLYELYEAVFEQSEIKFDKLSYEFFREVFRNKEARGVVFLYRSAGSLIGFNLCFEYAGNLIDKYIGLKYPEARDLNIYFLSWFVNLEYALSRGLKHYIAGWTDPQVKKALGAKFTFTSHAVYCRSPILRALLKPLRPLFEADAKVLHVENAVV